MMDWKKIGKRILTVLLLVLLGVEVCMELRYPCDELVVASKDTEAIFRRAPEVVVTEEDKALLTELLTASSVQGLLEKRESGDLPASENPDILDTAEKYLDPESAKSLNAGLFNYEGGYAMLLSWKHGKQIFCLQLKPEEDAYYKLYSPKRGTSYENWNNERAQKSEVHRRWLAWLRDGMWKDEE